MSRHILVVEDSALQANLLAGALEAEGCDVSVAHNGREAVAFLTTTVPSLVVSDIEMPLMNGYELCRHIRSQERLADIPVILLTSLTDPVDIIRGLEAGADNYVTKPYHPDYLLHRVHALLEKQISHDDSPGPAGTINVRINGATYPVTSGRQQILDLLISTFENAVHKNAELARTNQELLHVQQELVSRNAELERLLAFKSEMLGMAAHDVRGPLAGIVSAARFVQEEIPELPAEPALFVKCIIDHGDHLLGLVEDLLDVTTFESGKLNLEPVKADLAELVESGLVLARRLAETKGVRLDYRRPAGRVELFIDPRKMQQVLDNLLSNAIKFSPSGKGVEVTLEDGPEALLAVKDQGCGIARREHKLLFQPFGRTSARPTGGEKSTGLGLAIARKIVEGHGGRIWVESDLGAGATFFVALPSEWGREKGSVPLRSGETASAR